MMEEGTKIARALAAWTNKLRGEQHPAFVLSLPSCVPGELQHICVGKFVYDTAAAATN